MISVETDTGQEKKCLGKMKARVDESEDHEDELCGEEEKSSLVVTLDLIAEQIGVTRHRRSCWSPLLPAYVSLSGPETEYVDALIDYFNVQ